MNAPLVFDRAIIRAARVDDPADHARIDAFVRAQEKGTPFHLIGWNRAVAEGCGQRAHLLVAERQGEIAGLVPLTELHSPIFGRRLISSGFGVGGGILTAPASVIPANAGTHGCGSLHAESEPSSMGPGLRRDDEWFAELLAAAAVDLARRLSCASIELRGGAAPAGWHRDEASYASFARPLATDDEAELLAIPRKQRAEVRRAIGLPLTVEVGTAVKDRAAHYAVYAESVRNLGTPVFPPSLFAAVLDRFGDDADILTVRHEGRPVASVLSLYFEGSVMPYWGGGTAAARGLRANDLMYYALMNHARRRGCTTFDFGRSKPGTGAFAFKRNWGLEPAPLAYATWTANGRPPERVNPLDHGAKVRLWRKLPLPVANRIGPWIARGLG